MTNKKSESISSFPKNIKFSGSADLDMIKASDIVKKAIGAEPDFAMIFTYLFRRFGAPTMPQDDYKELCKYVLTTPMENIFLAVYPCASNFNFGFIYPQDTLRKVCWGNYGEILKWCIRMQEWAKKEHKINIFGNAMSNFSIYNKPNKKGICTLSKSNKSLFMKEINEWLSISYPHWAGKDVVVPQDKQQIVISEFFQYKKDEISKYEKLYLKVEKKPSIQSKEGIKLQKDIIKAISATAKDLLRPTYIRDVYFNILQNGCSFDGSTDKKHKESTVGYFDYSGQAQILRDSIQK